MSKTLKTATLPHSRRDFLGLAFRAQQLRRQLPRGACRPTRTDRSKYVLSSKVGKLLKASWAESRGSGNKTNDAPITAAGCYQRNRTTPDADIAATPRQIGVTLGPSTYQQYHIRRARSRHPLRGSDP
jgi:hypothetical protein